MKQTVIICAILLVCSQGFAQKQTVKQFINEFKQDKQVERVSLGGFLMGCIRLFSNNLGVKKIEIYSLEQCDSTKYVCFNSTIKQLELKEYDTVIASNEKNETSRILVKMKRNSIREVVILSCDEAAREIDVVRLKGKIKLSHLGDITKEYTKGGC